MEITDDATGEPTTVNVNTTWYSTNGNLDYCKFSEAFVGSNGVTYKIEKAQLIGNRGTYDYSARIYHPDHGDVAVTTNAALAYNCSAGFPSAGEGSFSDGNGNSVTVTFDNCSRFSWTYQDSTGATTSGTGTY